MLKSWIGLAGTALLACGCASTGAIERNAAGGAALGAIAGAVVGNNVGDGDAGTGAAVGAAIGAAAGAYKGCREDGGCGARQYDRGAKRYYYYDSRTGRYYWEDGSPRH